MRTGDAAKLGDEPVVEAAATADSELVLMEVDLTWQRG
jgi:hypothetical protein